MSSAVVVRLPRVLREVAGGQATVALTVEGDRPTVGTVLAALVERHPGVAHRIRDEQGALRPHVNVFVGPDNIRDLAGMETPVATGDEVAILPAVSGG